MISELVKNTTWPMTKPEAYGTFHILFLVFGLGLCVLVSYLLRKSSPKTTKYVLFSVGVFLLLSEIYKQLFYYFYIGDGQYQWWIFPFQLCSIPMYFCLAAPFIKSEKILNAIYSFLCTYNLMGAFLALFEPSGLSHEYITLTWHAFLWHTLLVFVGFYIIASGSVKMSLKDFKASTAVYIVLAVIAFAINCIFDKISGDSINMFFVGPNISPIVFFKSIATNYGWYTSTALFIPSVCLGAFIFYLIGRFVVKGKKFADFSA